MIAENNQKRIDGKWSLLNENIDEEGLAANALFKYLVRDEILNGIDEDELNEYNEKIKEYSEFLEKFESLKDRISDDELENLEEEGNEILFQLSELNDRNKADVYFIIPKGLYGERVYRFMVIGLPIGREYFVGLDKFMYELAVEDQANMLEGMDLEDLSFHFISRYLKEDEANEFIKDHFKDDIKENPKKYFTETDYQLTWQQENRKNNLESTIKELLSMPNNPDKKNTVKMSYMNQSGLIEFHEKTLEELQSELNSIKPPTEPTEDMIDEKVDELTEELLEDDDKKIKFLEEKSSIDNFIDFDEWARDVVQNEGYGTLSSEGENGWFDETVETPTRRYNFHIIENNN
jgi:hypothetical protein